MTGNFIYSVRHDCEDTTHKQKICRIFFKLKLMPNDIDVYGSNYDTLKVDALGKLYV